MSSKTPTPVILNDKLIYIMGEALFALDWVLAISQMILEVIWIFY